MGATVSVNQQSRFEELRQNLDIPLERSDEEYSSHELYNLVNLLQSSGVSSVSVVQRKAEELGIVLQDYKGDSTDIKSSGKSVNAVLCQLRQFLHEELGSIELFVDSSFPPMACSLRMDPHTDESVSWCRMRHLPDLNGSHGGVLFPPGEPKCTSVLQSSRLGNCYFITAVSVLAEHPVYLRRLFVSPSSRATDGDGCWTVRLHHDGRWNEVIIDDFLPITNSIGASNSKLYCGHNRPGCGFWVALLEKAYAKLYGSFGAISGGDIAEGLRDLSGSPVLSLRLDHGEGLEMIKNGSLWGNIVEMSQAGHLLACGWCGNTEETAAYLSRREAKSGSKNAASVAIVPNHAYAILNCAVKKGKKMLEIRNPWGKSEETEGISAADRSGCLWLSFDTWVTAVNALYSCVLHHDHLLKQDPSCLESPSLVTVSGAWKGGTAGGCSEHLSWRKNPQYVLTPPCHGTVYLTLSQPDKRKARETVMTRSEFEKIDYHQIGLEVIQIQSTRAAPELVTGKYTVLKKTSYWNKRDVSVALEVTEALVNTAIVIIPSTYFPCQEGKFTLTAEWHESSLRPHSSSPKAVVSSLPLVITEQLFGSKGSQCPDLVSSNDSIVCTPTGTLALSVTSFDFSYSFNDEWNEQRCGGAPHNPRFFLNPQFEVRVTGPTQIVFFVRQLVREGEKAAAPAPHGGQVITNKKKYIGIGASCYQIVDCLKSSIDVEIFCHGNYPIGDPVLSRAGEISKAISVDTKHNPILFMPCVEKGGRSCFQVEVLSNCPIFIDKAPATASQRQKDLLQEEIDKKSGGTSTSKSAKKENRSQKGKKVSQRVGSVDSGGVSFNKAKKTLSSLSDAYSNL